MSLLDKVIINAIVMLSLDIDTDPFKLINGKNNGIADNKQLKGTASSFYGLLSVVGIIGIILSIIICGILIYSKKDAKKRQEAKEQLLFKFIIAILIFSFSWIIGVVLKITINFV